MNKYKDLQEKDFNLLSLKVKIIGSTSCTESVQAKQLCEENNLKMEWVDSKENSEITKQMLQNFKMDKTPIIFLNNELLGGILTPEEKDKKDTQKEIINENEIWFGLKKTLRLSNKLFITYYDNIDITTDEQDDYQAMGQTQKTFENNDKNQYSEVKFTTKENNQQQQQVEQKDKEDDQKEEDEEVFDVHHRFQLTINNFVKQEDDIEFKKPEHTLQNMKERRMRTFRFSIPVVIISGFPSYLFKWKKFQMGLGENSVRIIHFLIPGMDRIDERRGPSYKGDTDDICKLLKQLLNYLNINKIILMAQSFAQFILAKFQLMYPNLVAGTSLVGNMSLFPQTNYKDRALKYTSKQKNT